MDIFFLLGFPPLRFSGLEGQDVLEFLHKVRTKAYRRRKDDRWMCQYVGHCFKGQALKFYIRLNTTTKGNWDLLEQALIDEFGAGDKVDIHPTAGVDYSPGNTQASLPLSIRVETPDSALNTMGSSTSSPNVQRSQRIPGAGYGLRSMFTSTPCLRSTPHERHRSADGSSLAPSLLMSQLSSSPPTRATTPGLEEGLDLPLANLGWPHSRPATPALEHYGANVIFLYGAQSRTCSPTPHNIQFPIPERPLADHINGFPTVGNDNPAPRKGRIRLGELGTYMMQDIRQPYASNLSDRLVVEVPAGVHAENRWKMRMTNGTQVQEGYPFLGVYPDDSGTFVFDSCTERSTTAPMEKSGRQLTAVTTIWFIRPLMDDMEELCVEIEMKDRTTRQLEVWEEVTYGRRPEQTNSRIILRYQSARESDSDDVKLTKTRLLFEPFTIGNSAL